MKAALIMFGNTCAAFLTVASVVQGLNWLDVAPTPPILMALAVLTFILTALLQDRWKKGGG